MKREHPLGSFWHMTERQGSVGTDHSGRSPVPAAPALVWFGSGSSAGGSSAWASRGPPRRSPPSRLSEVASPAWPRPLSPRLRQTRRQEDTVSTQSGTGHTEPPAGRTGRLYLILVDVLWVCRVSPGLFLWTTRLQAETKRLVRQNKTFIPTKNTINDRILL